MFARGQRARAVPTVRKTTYNPVGARPSALSSCAIAKDLRQKKFAQTEILRCAQNDKFLHTIVGANCVRPWVVENADPYKLSNLLCAVGGFAAGARSRLPARSVLLHTSVCRGLHRRPAPRPTESRVPKYFVCTNSVKTKSIYCPLKILCHNL